MEILTMFLTYDDIGDIQFILALIGALFLIGLIFKKSS